MKKIQPNSAREELGFYYFYDDDFYIYTRIQGLNINKEKKLEFSNHLMNDLAKYSEVIH